MTNRDFSSTWDTGPVPEFVIVHDDGPAIRSALNRLPAEFREDTPVAGLPQAPDVDRSDKRAVAAHAWFKSCAAELFGDEWLPLSIREHFGHDWPQEHAELLRLRATVAASNEMLANANAELRRLRPLICEVEQFPLAT